MRTTRRKQLIENERRKTGRKLTRRKNFQLGLINPEKNDSHKLSCEVLIMN